MHAKMKLGVKSGGASGGNSTKRRKTVSEATYSAKKLVAKKD